MARRRRSDGFDRTEAIIKVVLLGFVLLTLAVGGATGLVKTFQGLVSLVMFAVVALLALGAVYLVVRFGFRQWQLRRSPGDGNPAQSGGQDLDADSRHRRDREASDVTPQVNDESAVHLWTNAKIQAALGEIDWYQFEKYCAALLCREGFDVERKGGAQPDGGVDLIASRDGERMLVQCKHWRTWVVQEKVVREMLGSMAHFQATRGSIYTLKGWTKPAAEFARQHRITLADADDLAHRGLACLEADQLDRHLNPRVRHCPKCEAEMVFRTGNFTSFWGCSTYPRCRGKLNHAGAR